MKKIAHSFSALLLTVALLMVSCNSKNNPKEVANTWLTSFYHMDYEAAKKVSTEDTKTLLSQLAAFSGMMPDSSKNEMKKATVSIKDVKEAGDSAWVTYTIGGIGKDTPPDFPPLKLVKQKGQWLVLFTKADQMGGGGNNAADTTNTPPPAGAGADSTMAPADTTHH